LFAAVCTAGESNTKNVDTTHLQSRVFSDAILLFLYQKKMRDGSTIRLAVVGKPSKVLRVEVASKQESLTQGLQGRDPLPPDTGMLFVFPEEGRQSLWMPPTMRFALDMIWLDSSMKIVGIYRDARPCRTRDDCPSISSYYRVKYAIEMTAGQADAVGLEPGMRFRLA
jgi:uncharacterized membrane protein (UPF0127 family)